MLKYILKHVQICLAAQKNSKKLQTSPSGNLSFGNSKIIRITSVSVNRMVEIPSLVSVGNKIHGAKVPNT